MEDKGFVYCCIFWWFGLRHCEKSTLENLWQTCFVEECTFEPSNILPLFTIPMHVEDRLKRIQRNF